MRSGHSLLLFSVIAKLSPLPLLKFGILVSLISELMVTCLDDRMVNTHNVRAEAKALQANGNPPPPPTLLKPSPRSLSPMMSRRSCCDSLWPTLLVEAMGQGMLPFQLRPPKVTSGPLIRRSSPRQESLLRLTIGFVNRVHVWAPTLHGGAEDSLHRAAAAW
jgi:hypothetical protein